MALALDGAHNVAQAVLLGQAICWERLWVVGAISETHDIIAGISIDDSALALTSEHRLDLLKDISILALGWLKQAELPSGGLAPEEGPLWEASVTDSVLADSNVVVRLDTYNSCKHQSVTDKT